MKYAILILIFPALLLSGSWRYSSSKNEITNEKSFFATSPYTQATQTMRFPYANTKAWIGIGCKKGEQWAYFGFSNIPNLLNTVNGDGYSWVVPSFRIDNRTEPIKLIQEWGSSFLHISNDGYIDANKFISMVKQGNILIIELKWYGNGETYFKFSLKNSKKIIDKMQKRCGYKAIN